MQNVATLTAFQGLSLYQRKTFNWLDNKVMHQSTRGIEIGNKEIAHFLGCDRRRVIEVMKTLQERGLIKKTTRYREHGGFGPNEYLVMPANPRKFQLIHEIAADMNADPFDLLVWIGRMTDLYKTMGENVKTLSIAQFAEMVGAPIDAMLRLAVLLGERGLAIEKGITHW